MTVTFNHTGITVKDLDHSEAMFRDLFGFETISRAARDPQIISKVIGVEGAKVEIAYMRSSTTTVELLCYSAPDDLKNYAPRACDVGSLHLGFNVPDMDDALEKAKNYGLKLMGDVVIIDAGPNKGSRIAYLRDAIDGVVLELIQPPAK
ncbi:VOC family protein [Brucellaceae bacterium C25G]